MNFLHTHGYTNPIPGAILVNPIYNDISCAKELSIIIPWIVEVADEFQLQVQCIFIAIDMIYRIYHKIITNGSSIQLMCMTCLMIAANLVEKFPPSTMEYIYISDNTYSERQVIDMEFLIVKTLKGILYTNNLYTYAFSLQSLKQAYPLLLDCEKYSKTDLSLFMSELAEKESVEERQNRKTKMINIASFLGEITPSNKN